MLVDHRTVSFLLPVKSCAPAAQSTFSKATTSLLLTTTGQMLPNFCHHLKPLAFPSNRRWLGIRLSSTSTKHHEPLRVLFCGADAFSIYSLCALHKLQQAHPEKIASIDVVCRPDKRVGRGLKKIQEGSYPLILPQKPHHKQPLTPRSPHQTHRNLPFPPHPPN